MNDVLINTLQRITGGKPADYYLGGFVFTFAALLLSWYLASRKRDVYSPNTPVKYSWTFLIWDNTKKGVVTMILAFIFYRVYDLNLVWLQIGLGFFLSFGLDKVIQWLMDKTDFLKFLERDRTKFVKNQNENNEQEKPD